VDEEREQAEAEDSGKRRPTINMSSKGVTAAEDSGDGGPTAAGNDDSRDSDDERMRTA